MTHRHKAKRSYDRGWQYCIANHGGDHGSHGNIIRTETCRCGATRKVEINGKHRAATRWDDEFADYGGRS